MNDKYVSIWKEMVVAYFEVISWNLHIMRKTNETLRIASNLAKIQAGYCLNTSLTNLLDISA